MYIFFVIYQDKRKVFRFSSVENQLDVKRDMINTAVTFETRLIIKKYLFPV